MCRLSSFFPGKLITIWSGKTSVMLHGNGCQMLRSWNGKIRERKGVIIFFLANLAYTDRKRKVLLDIMLYFLVLEVSNYMPALCCTVQINSSRRILSTIQDLSRINPVMHSFHCHSYSSAVLVKSM